MMANWNLLRLYAVLLVLYGNGFVLTHGGGRGLWGMPFADAGLALLFAISGYLTSVSWNEAPRLGRFMFGRGLRVLPALAVCVLVTMLVIGPLGTHLALRRYLLSGQTRGYLSNIVLVLQTNLPGLFVGQEWAGAANPMLWTLSAGLYGALAVTGIAQVPAWARPWVCFALVLVCGGVALLQADQVGSVHLSHSYQADLAMLAFFFGGVGLQGLEAGGGRWFRADAAILCFAGNWIAASWIGAATLPLLWVTIPYMAVAFGRLAAPGLGLRRFGNPSYGMFLYAFPIQQLIVARLPLCPHPILLCCVLSVVAGLMSWHLVERPALVWGRLVWAR